jgi:hypothetical protein
VRDVSRGLLQAVCHALLRALQENLPQFSGEYRSGRLVDERKSGELTIPGSCRVTVFVR